MINLANKRVHERKVEVDNWFVCYERWLPSITLRFESGVRLSRLSDAVTARQEKFGDERLDPSCGAVVESVLTAAGDDKED